MLAVSGAERRRAGRQRTADAVAAARPARPGDRAPAPARPRLRPARPVAAPSRTTAAHLAADGGVAVGQFGDGVGGGQFGVDSFDLSVEPADSQPRAVAASLAAGVRAPLRGRCRSVKGKEKKETDRPERKESWAEKAPSATQSADSKWKRGLAQILIIPFFFRVLNSA